MKKRSKLYRLFAELLCVVISITGIRTSVFATSTSLSCEYLLCSNTIQATSPLKVGSTVPSGVPVYAGQSLSSINSSFNDTSNHYVFMYCNDFSSSLIKKRHTCVVMCCNHKYDVGTDEYKQCQVGEYVVNKYLDGSGNPCSMMEYNSETGKYDLRLEYIREDLISAFHYRKFKCGGSNSIMSVENLGSGNSISLLDAVSDVKALGGCGNEFYALQSHNKIFDHIGHLATEGRFLFTNDEDNVQYNLTYSELTYDESVNGYTLPNADFYFKTKPVFNESSYAGINLLLGYRYSDGSSKSVTYIPARSVCFLYKHCDDCGWNFTVKGAGYPKSTYTSIDSSVHHVKTVCQSCGEIYKDEDEEHSWKKFTYTSLNSSEHSVTRACNISGCGYTDTLNGNHTFTYGSWKSDDSNTHTRTVSCRQCGYSGTETAKHSIETTYTSLSATEHQKVEKCTDCGYTATSSENHSDKNNDDKCDDCGYEINIFSVTVPTTMEIVIDKNGKVFTPTNVAIYNNSTKNVKVSKVSLTGKNGWEVVSYSTNMANEKVDSKKIGIKINDSESDNEGNLPLSESWIIEEDSSLPLEYDAKVSATSSPIAGTNVVDVNFVIDWSDE